MKKIEIPSSKFFVPSVALFLTDRQHYNSCNETNGNKCAKWDKRIKKLLDLLENEPLLYWADSPANFIDF